MNKKLSFASVLLLSLLALAVWGAAAGSFSPGARTVMLAHNADGFMGKWTDRLGRAIATGTPFAVQINVVWAANPKTGKTESVIGHTAESATDQTLKTLFLKRVQPIMEKALKEKNNKDWPLVTLYLDIKNGTPEHLASIWSLLGEYESWLTTAVKTKGAAEVSPLVVGPLLVLVEDQAEDIREDYFYNRLPVGSKLRLFGSAKVTLPPGKGLEPKDIRARQARMKLPELVPGPASNYRRWWNSSWEMVEVGPPDSVGSWTPAKEARLKAIVDYAHKMGYLVGFKCTAGFKAGTVDKLGWEQEFNFGSLESATIRWKAAVKAGADFISTDQFEDVAKVIRSRN